MRRPFSILVAAAVIGGICVGCAHAGEGPSEAGGDAVTTLLPENLDEISDQLCEIYSQIPVRKMILIDRDKRPLIQPVVVHRCQTLTFEVDSGRASFSITDRYIAEANRSSLRPSDGKVGDTIVLWIAAGETASVVVPETYPDKGRPVFVRYYVECFDPKSEEPYECEGTSPPRVIIPPVRDPR